MMHQIRNFYIIRDYGLCYKKCYMKFCDTDYKLMTALLVNEICSMM
jgi:hypothetical protein